MTQPGSVHTFIHQGPAVTRSPVVFAPHGHNKTGAAAGGAQSHYGNW